MMVLGKVERFSLDLIGSTNHQQHRTLNGVHDRLMTMVVASPAVFQVLEKEGKKEELKSQEEKTRMGWSLSGSPQVT
jgi:hypothetical protein